MKKRNNTLWALALLGCLVSFEAFSQGSVNHPQFGNSGTFSTTPCPFFYNYFDNGGPAAPYAPNQFFNQNAITFAPANPAAGRVRLNFTAYATEANFDGLYIYNSNLSGVNQVNGGGGAPFQGGAPAGIFYNSPGAIIANTGLAAVGANPAEAISLQFVADGSVQGAGWTAVVDEVQKSNCIMTVGGPVQVSASASGCPGPVTVNAPTFSPVGCQNAFAFQYSVNGGAFTTTAYSAQVVLNGLQLGANVVVWRIVDPCNNAVVSSGTQNLNVVDLVPPVVTCPGNVTLNLPPGECSTFYSYSVSMTDNCPFVVPATPTQHPASFLAHGGGTVFSLQGNALPGGIYYNLTNTGTTLLTITGFGIRFGNPAFGAVTPPKTMQVFTKAGSYAGFETNAAAWTNLGPQVITAIPPYFATGTGPLAQMALNSSVNVAPGTTVAFHVFGIAACPIFNYFNQTGPQASGPWTMQGGPISFGQFGPLFQAGATSAPNIQVNFSQTIAAVPVQYAGLPSGSEFPIGTTTNCFRGTDVAGNQSTCCFSVTVNEYPNAIQSLICNNNVQVSLDPNCSAYVNADQVLEGGPYGCYDNYVVEVDKTLPFGNGPWVRISKGPAFPGFGAPTPLGPGDVGKTYQVKVTDPKTGNHCWGNLVIEDKFAPVLDCDPTFVACNASSFEPCVDPITILPTAPVQLPPSFVAHGGGTAFSLAGNTQPGGYYLNLRNNDNLPLTVTGFGIRWGNPQFGQVNPPQTVDIFARPTTYVGFETNAAAWTNLGPVVYTVMPPYFATGTGPLSNGNLLQKVTIQPGATHAFHIFGRTACPIFNYFNSTGPQTNFPWVMQGGPISFGLFGPLFQAGAMSAPNIQVLFEKQAPPTCLPNGLVLNQNTFQIGQGTYRANAGAGTPVLDACSDVTLTYVDSSVDQPCTSSNSKTITRKWTAKDASGNTSTCNQTVNVLRPTLSDLELPPSYDDVDELAIPCGGVYPTPDWVTSQGLQGWPLVFGKPVGCDFGWNYTDVRIDVCDGTYKVRRRWTILNWCTGLNTDHDQIIKIKDDVAPTFTCPANITVGTDPFACCATVDLPDFIVTDNCSRIKKVSAMVITFDPQTNQQTGMQVVT
ncbi:MAG: HYR domain-containing protein, partial [Saprospiraceae bacterium]